MARQTIIFLGSLFLFILIIGMLYTSYNGSIFEGAGEIPDEETDPNKGKKKNESGEESTEESTQ
jgi:hypothetical protein